MPHRLVDRPFGPDRVDARAQHTPPKLCGPHRSERERRLAAWRQAAADERMRTAAEGVEPRQESRDSSPMSRRSVHAGHVEDDHVAVADQPEKIEEILAKTADPVGLAYRFGLATSFLSQMKYKK